MDKQLSKIQNYRLQNLAMFQFSSSRHPLSRIGIVTSTLLILGLGGCLNIDLLGNGKQAQVLNKKSKAEADELCQKFRQKIAKVYPQNNSSTDELGTSTKLSKESHCDTLGQ
jgi:hypothetical protein